VTGTDLTPAMLERAAALARSRGLANLTFLPGDLEQLPFPDASFDIVTCVYLYHELPNEVRRRVTSEIARVLKPGGLFVFVDSLQWGDVDGYDGLLEAFPQRFHEPYYTDYLGDSLDGPEGLFARSGLQPESDFPAFLSKIVICRKAA
jgi:ubiquinone/menaquinone biosynthesis C-methylase UbiE